MNRRKPGAMIEDEDEAINRVIRMIKKESRLRSLEKILILRQTQYAFTEMERKHYYCGEDP